MKDAPPFQHQARDPRLAGLLQDYPDGLFSDALYQSIELMERYSIDLAIDLLNQLQVFSELNEPQTVPALIETLSLQPRFEFALAWLLDRLIETGLIEARGEGKARLYRSLHTPWPPQHDALRAIGLEIAAANAPALDLFDYAAALYPGVARGERSGEEALFGPQGITLWANYFHNQNLTYAVNNWVGAVAAAQSVCDHPTLRILELGAGAGSGTEILLRCLDERGLLPRVQRYLVTEPNAFFRRRAQRELSRQYPALPLEWASLDMNLPWQSQGVSAGDFDLVFGVNVLHVAKDLLAALREARSALAPGGHLVAGECLRPFLGQPIYAELVFQILNGFTDVKLDPEFRPNPGFLTPEQWRSVFEAAGFDQVEITPDFGRIRPLYRHFFTGAISGRRPLA